MSSRTRNGKIARLPFAVREEINRRLRDNASGPEILAWLNAEHLQPGQEPFNAENLSNWRAGGFAEWLADQAKVEAVGKLGEYCLRIAQAAGHSITDGAAAIAGGKILECLEAATALEVLDEEEGKPAGDPPIVGLTMALAKLRDSEAKLLVARTAKDKVRQKDEDLSLARENFALKAGTLFLRWFDDRRARDIAESGASNAEKIAALRQLYFADIDELEKAGEVQLPA